MASHHAAVLEIFERHAHIFDLDRGLGEELMDITIEVIERDMEAETNPDGSPWPPLSENYAAWKAANYPGRQMGELTLLMKQDTNLRGERYVSPKLARMVYGTDMEAREHAEHFQAAGRRFYELSIEAEQRLADHCRDHLAQNL